MSVLHSIEMLSNFKGNNPAETVTELDRGTRLQLRGVLRIKQAILFVGVSTCLN